MGDVSYAVVGLQGQQEVFVERSVLFLSLVASLFLLFPPVSPSVRSMGSGVTHGSYFLWVSWGKGCFFPVLRIIRNADLFPLPSASLFYFYF